MIYYITPVVLNFVCYAILLPYVSPEIFSEHFISIILIFAGNMMSFTWKYIISITMKFEFNSYTGSCLTPVIFTFISTILHFKSLQAYEQYVILGSLLVVWGYNLKFVPTVITQIATHLNIPVFKIRKVEVKES